MNIEDLKSLMDAFDPASLLPELTNVLDVIVYAVRIATLVGPAVLLVFGLGYLIFAPKEANYYFGYRCTFGMGSVEAWRFTQKLAGIVWTVLGLVLTIAMVILTNDLQKMAVYDALWQAVEYVLWEVGLVAVACVAINTIVMTQFTFNGDYRKDRVGK